MKNINLNTLRDKVEDISIKEGLHNFSNEHLLFLAIKELIRFYNAYRKLKWADTKRFKNWRESTSYKQFMAPFESCIKNSIEDCLVAPVIILLEIASKEYRDEYRNCDINGTALNMVYKAVSESSVHDVVFSIIQSCCIYDEDKLFTKNILYDIFALAKTLDIDLMWYIEQKMKYYELKRKTGLYNNIEEF